MLVFLDISIGGVPTGRIVIELFPEAPATAERFRQLGPSLVGTYFHRVIKNFVVQGGDTVHAVASRYNSSDVGVGGGGTFPDENLAHSLDEPFFVCLANSGPNTNGTQFFITTAPAPHLQGKHLVFGRVVYGKAVVRAMERVATTAEHVPKPEELPVVEQFGSWAQGDPVPVHCACYDPIGGDVYEEWPDDDSHIVKDSSELVYEAAEIIKNLGAALLKAGRPGDALLKFQKLRRYVMEYFPDPDQEPDHYARFQALKTKLFLNMSLACLKMGNHAKCVEYCNVLLDLDLTQPQRAKTLYRLGVAMAALNRHKEAVTILETAHALQPDPATLKELERTQAALQRKKDKEKAQYAKFFG